MFSVSLKYPLTDLLTVELVTKFIPERRVLGQVLRESAVSTSTAKEPSQSVTFQQNSFVYINGSGEGAAAGMDIFSKNEKKEKS